MKVTELLVQAAWLMLTGMTVVFLFLALLILIVRLMSRFLAPKEGEQAAAVNVKAATAVSNAHIAAISAAVARYKQTRK